MPMQGRDQVKVRILKGEKHAQNASPHHFFNVCSLKNPTLAMLTLKTNDAAKLTSKLLPMKDMM